MTEIQQIKLWLSEDESRVGALLLANTCAQHFGIKDWYLAAGFVRNLVWARFIVQITVNAELKT